MTVRGLGVGLIACVIGAAACEERTARPKRPKTSPSAKGMCVEHGVPEALCTKCNPALATVFEAKGDWCVEHGFPESYCPICNPDVRFPDVDASRSGLPAIEARTVRFRTPATERAAGIATEVAVDATAAAQVECSARIAFDADRVADIRALVPGIIRRVRVELGTSVRRGTPLFELESTRVGEIQAALETARERGGAARANLDRQRKLRKLDVASARQVELAGRELAEASAAARAAEATLRMAGAARAAPTGRYKLVAPIAGTVVRRPAVLGLLATESVSLATIADTSVMWALCEVPESDASRVEVGQRVRVFVGGREDEPFDGEVSWIAAEVDARTRTVTARADVPNMDGRLRANQFARARIQTNAPKTAVAVPRSAVQRVEGAEVVFVRTATAVYEPRIVKRTGGGSLVQVEGRVERGDEVVTTGAVLLRAEIMPGSIGAGCCETTPGGR